MKNIMMLWIMHFLALPAQANEGIKPSISLHQRQVDLVSIFNKIEEQVAISFVYSNEVKQIKRKVSVNYTNKSLTAVMDHLAKVYHLGYKSHNNNVTVYLEQK